MPPWSRFSLGAFCAALTLANVNGAPPIVDLGYTLHQATIGHTNDGVSYFNFSNIRYAAPPTGGRRFTAPAPPARDRTVQDGQTEFICAQASPGWTTTSTEVVSGQPITRPGKFTKQDIPPVDPRTSEDCLFLDVVASRSVFNKKKSSPGAAVLLWIHGGGYASGSKTYFGYPQNFISLSDKNRDGGIIYVAINYRLGLFGWLGTVIEDHGGVANAGLLDQRFALEWVKKYIHLFGGDPNRVTVMGESAGGGSVLQQITAYGGTKGSVPFARAIPQSPFVQPIPRESQEHTYKEVMRRAGVSTYKALKNVPSKRLQTVNALVIGNARPYGTFAFGPVVDGSFVRGLPGPSLANGHFDRSVNVMTGHNSDEGLLFASPFVKPGKSYRKYLRAELPGISANAVDHIANVLYPRNFNGSFGYTDQLGRTDATIGDFSINCNTFFLNDALPNRSYAYQFSVPPGLHGNDIAYTFYNGNPNSSLNTTLAELMQQYFLNFAVTGSPNAKGLPYFPRYKGEKELNLNNTKLRPMHDDTASKRCRWWQKGLYRSTSHV